MTAKKSPTRSITLTNEWFNRVEDRLLELKMRLDDNAQVEMNHSAVLYETKHKVQELEKRQKESDDSEETWFTALNTLRTDLNSIDSRVDSLAGKMGEMKRWQDQIDVADSKAADNLRTVEDSIKLLIEARNDQALRNAELYDMAQQARTRAEDANGKVAQALVGSVNTNARLTNVESQLATHRGLLNKITAGHFAEKKVEPPVSVDWDTFQHVMGVMLRAHSTLENQMCGKAKDTYEVWDLTGKAYDKLQKLQP